jgi:hypothetical protein
LIRADGEAMSVGQRLIGTWRLVSFVYELANGAEVNAYGARPAGLLVYDANGMMTAQIASLERPRFASGDRRTGTRDELHAAVEGYIAYFGTYEVDEAEGYVTHYEQGDVFPNAVGTKQRRYFEIDGDRLVLSVPPVVLGGERMTARVVWERVGPARREPDVGG